MSEEINYKSYPQVFSNSALINVHLFERLSEVIEGIRVFQAIDLLILQSITETVVLQEKIVLEDESVAGGISLVEGSNYSSAVEELIRQLNKGNVFDLDNLPTKTKTASELLQNEASILSTPGAEAIRVNYIHGSHIIIEHLENTLPSIPIEDFSSDNLPSRISQTWSPNYVDALVKFDEYYEAFEGFAPQPWKLLADCHGIPYIDSPFYSLRDINLLQPTNIGIDLYRKLEELHKDYFQKIQKYLGPTYVDLPPILNLVFEQSKRPEDIPTSIIAVRDRFKDFRKTCTSLEIELRQAKKLSQQIEIIREIESVYSGLSKRIEKPKNRVLLRLFDILKEVDPIHMTVKALDQIKEYLIEEEGLIKMPSYFNLWKALTSTKSKTNDLKKIFGNQISPNIIEEFHQIKNTIKSDEADYYEWEYYDVE